MSNKKLHPDKVLSRCETAFEAYKSLNGNVLAMLKGRQCLVEGNRKGETRQGTITGAMLGAHGVSVEIEIERKDGSGKLTDLWYRNIKKIDLL